MYGTGEGEITLLITTVSTTTGPTLGLWLKDVQSTGCHGLEGGRGDLVGRRDGAFVMGEEERRRKTRDERFCLENGQEN